MNTILLFLLKYTAKILLLVHRPKIIGVTGTVGKTTVTTHIYNYLSSLNPQERIGYSHHHYNGEYGLPLTIIGDVKSPGKNVFRWIYIFLYAFLRIFSPRYPRYLVLEYGIDHPGEMDFLCSISYPDIAILTEVAPNHIEQFGTLERYRNEKLKILKNACHAIVHESLRAWVDRDAVYYGKGAVDHIDMSHVEVGLSGTTSQIHVWDKSYTIHTGLFGDFHILNLLPLYGIARIFGYNTAIIESYARSMTVESGRGRTLRGVQSSMIIDATYNGGYLAIREGIRSLLPLAQDKNIIIALGDMRELGNLTESTHAILADDIVQLCAPYAGNIKIFLVGPMMGRYVFPRIESIFSVEHSLSSRDIGKKIYDSISHNKDGSTIVYLKGSQNTIFLEDAIPFFLQNPADTSLLCRQSDKWKKIKSIFFEKEIQKIA